MGKTGAQKKQQQQQQPLKGIKAEKSTSSVASAGPLVCAACKTRPSQAEWAANIKRGGATTPTGQKCLKCHQEWQRAFSYLAFDQYAKLVNSEDSCHIL